MLSYKSLYNKPITLPSLDFDMSDISPTSLPIKSFFDQELTCLTQVGAKTHKNLMRLCGHTMLDFLYHMPHKAIDRRPIEALDMQNHQDKLIAIEVTVKRHLIARSPKAPYRVITECATLYGTTELQLIFFRANGEYIQNMLPINMKRLVSGKLEIFDSIAQMVHPEYIVAVDQKNELPTIQPLYQLTAGVTQRLMHKAMRAAATALREIKPPQEWHRADLMQRYGWQDIITSLGKIHIPQTLEESAPEGGYRQRLAYDAILAHQLSLAIKRAKRQKKPAIAIQHHQEMAQKIMQNLPFELTGDQKTVTQEIYEDLKKPYQMSRMVQGDVGSGKTIVALLAASMVIQEKYQAAIMAPTEILAKQHYASLKPLCKQVGIRIGVLTGKDKASESKKTLEKLKNGEIDLIIGTHALIQAKVQYKNLALAIIDEQHRFGVAQRDALVQKGTMDAHLLLMTATPIPRSLAMAQYGDCDLSLIQEKPPFRKEVITRVMPQQKIDALMTSLQRVIDQKGRAYWVCPLVEESEKIDLMAAEERFKIIASFYPTQVGLVHGKMKSAEKDAVINDFVTGKINILVSTTVIEVGVNVPEATAMIIEEAERFGLSQLHQLRGRVGRGAAQSSCVLLYKTLNPVAIERLSILKQSDDGFVLAQKDLELRGAGDLLGTKQTGILHLPAFEFEHHHKLIKIARDDAHHLLETDPQLTSARGKNIRVLLDLFKTHIYDG